MRFTAREDIEAPADKVFAALTDFDGFEREALRRGAEVTPEGDHDGPELGRGWRIRFAYRGRERALETRISAFEPARQLAATGKIGGLEGDLQFDLVALSAQTTRLTVDLHMRPTNLSSRLFVQSLKLAKTSLMKRFSSRLKYFAQKLERG